MNLRNIDLYTGIVLASLLLLPIGGWWTMKLREDLAASKAAIREASRSDGLIEQIGQMQGKIEIVAQNRSTTSDAIKDPRTYFEGQILAAAAGSLKANDFSPKAPKEEGVTIPGSKQRASDFVVDVDFGKEVRGDLSFVYAMLFMCESGARFGGRSTSPSVWRLRELSIVNETNDRAVTGRKVPTPELQDSWSIKKVSFARREPKKQ